MPENDNKDFLDQFTNDGKPASFKEEERVPVQKERKPLNVKLIAILLAAIVALGVLAYFLFFSPKIEMLDFVGRSRSDVAAWVKQQGIETSGIIFNEEYSFEYDADTVISQSVPAGKKVKNDVKINFVSSLGPDPDEAVGVPDLDNMEKTDIQTWISENKLLKTKISTSYSESVAKDEVIDYQFTGCEEENFTRGCTLKINISKGQAPAGKVTVEDFEKKLYESAEAWAKSKKVLIEKTEAYSDKVDSGYIISQSVPAGKTMNEGETLNVVVSKGKAVYMPDMVGWNDKQVKAWTTKNSSVALYETEYYSDKQKGIVLYQSIPAGNLIKDDDYVELRVSMGNIVDLPQSFIGTEYHAPGGLHDWKDKQNDLGADITVNRMFEFSDTIEAGHIIRHDSGVYVGGTLNVWVSEGKNILLKDITLEDKTYTWADLVAGNADEDYARVLLNENKLTYEIDYAYREGLPNGRVISIRRWDDKPIAAGTYIPQNITVYVTVCDDSYR